jgi:hypothetical protein
MKLKNLEIPNFIIGGTYKAATTSVFKYLRDHPQVCDRSFKGRIIKNSYKAFLSLSNPKATMINLRKAAYIKISRSC